MYLMTATRKLQGVASLTAEIEIDRRGQRWSEPLAVELVWFDSMNAGVKFTALTPEAREMLEQLLEDALPLPAYRRHQRMMA